MQVAIDFGISNTDVVTRVGNELRCWNRPSHGQPNHDTIVAVLASGGIDHTAVTQLAVTGGSHRSLLGQADAYAVVPVGEVEAIGRGGQALAASSGQPSDRPLLVVSAGSGTAVVAARGNNYAHVTGSGVGGGTLLGLGRLLLHTTDPHEIDALASSGNPNGADLSLSDVVSGPIGSLPADATAVNFGRLARYDIAVRREDLAAALVTLVGQVIAVTAINAARAQQLEGVVVIGHLTDMESMRRVLASVGGYYGMQLTLPSQAGYATALGALLALEHAAHS